MIDDRLSALLDDPDFRGIQDRMARFNLFEAIGAVHGELRHSNFLAYLLSPNRPHNLGDKCLQQVLRRVLESMAPADRPLSTLELLVGDLDDAVVHRERDSIDLLIEIDALGLVVLVENKVHAKAGKGQLRRYRELVEARYPTRRKLLVFLTPDGHAPDDPGYQALSYATLASTLGHIVSELPMGDPTGLIVRHYVDMLRRNLVEDDHLRSLAARLYERHAEALDFIFENKPRTASLVDVVTQIVRGTDGFVIDTDGAVLRFAPGQWDEKLVYLGDKTDWTKSGRGLLFEVKSPKLGRLNVSLIIGPGDADYRLAFHEAAQKQPELFTGLQKSMGVKYCTLFSKDLLTAERAANLSADAQAELIAAAWSDFESSQMPLLADAVLELDAEVASSLAKS